MLRLLTILFLFLSLNLISQNVGIGTNTPDPSAALEINDANKGLLIPRLDTSAVNTPAVGLMIFQASNNGFYFFNGSNWQLIGSVANVLEDADSDTKITVEQSPDEDKFRFFSKDVEVMRHDGKILEMLNNGQSVFIGQEAGIADDQSDNKNVFIGYKAGTQNTTGTQNISIGNQALKDNINQSSNIAIGQQASMKSNASNNISIGFNAARDNLVGTKNIKIGNFSGFTNQNGDDNIIIGDEAGRGAVSTSYDGSIFIGSRAGYANEENSNLGIGREALRNNTDGINNLAIGDSSLFSNTGQVLEGYGSSNTAVGKNAGKTNTFGRQNTFVGTDSGRENTGGNFNTFVGAEAGKESRGSSNTFVGYGSGSENQNAIHNSFLGNFSGFQNSTGTNNTFLGSLAGLSSTTGDDNVIVGQNAGRVNFNGSDNVYIGQNAAKDLLGGNKNTFVGFETGMESSNGVEGNIHIGHQAGKFSKESNRLYIDNSDTTDALIYGNFDSLELRVNGELQIGNPDSSGFQFPTEDGNSGQLLKSDGAGNLVWAADNNSNSNPPANDPTCCEPYEDYIVAPQEANSFYVDLGSTIPGGSNSPNHTGEIDAYGFDLSYKHISTAGNCNNIKVTFRKAVDIATPKIFSDSFTRKNLGDTFIYQEAETSTGTLYDRVKIRLKNTIIEEVSQEVFFRGDGEFTTYEVVELSFSGDVQYTYNFINTNGTTSQVEELLICN